MFWLELFLEVRAEIKNIVSFSFWFKWEQENLLSKLTDLYLYTYMGFYTYLLSSESTLRSFCMAKWLLFVESTRNIWWTCPNFQLFNTKLAVIGTIEKKEGTEKFRLLIRLKRLYHQIFYRNIKIHSVKAHNSLTHLCTSKLCNQVPS